MVVLLVLGTTPLAACGGGGGSSEGELAEVSSPEHHHVRLPHRSRKTEQQKKEVKKHLRQVERENRVFQRAEEDQLIAKEKQEQKAKEEAKYPSGVPRITAEEFYSVGGIDRGNWEIAYSICGTTPLKQLSREFHSSDPTEIAHKWGAEYKTGFEVAPEEGCLAALTDSCQQWEDAENELPFKEL